MTRHNSTGHLISSAPLTGGSSEKHLGSTVLVGERTSSSVHKPVTDRTRPPTNRYRKEKKVVEKEPDQVPVSIDHPM